ncbi:MAG: P-loop NTPase [Chroococcidiopsidaceae cyanobacterium CP_BM_ER_R8_30]|nr:P-loop NTPase [Chroococcidiopsidaceae cyanobacterium CP_BM_ER_R8_30]
MIQTLLEQQRNITALLNQEGQKIAGTSLKDPQVQTYQGPLRQSLITQAVGVRNQIQVLQVRDQVLNQREAALRQQVKQFPAIQRQFSDLEGRLDIATKTLNQLLIQRATLRVDDAQKEEPWEVVSKPGIPVDANGRPIPVPIKTSKQILLGILGGLLLGLGAAVLKEKYRNIFYTSDDLQEGLNLPLLGVIPFEPNIQQIIKSSAFVNSIEEAEAEQTEATLFVESFTSLYASIRFLASAPPVSSLVVSSATPGDGKTTVALHLAQTAAALGQRVLLVDANLRLPDIHNKLDLSQEQGLSDLLSENINPKEVIRRSLLNDKLFILTSGKPRSESIKMLPCTQMKNLMSEFEAAFDMVIYDTPYLGPADANFIAANTDGILMVVAVGKTERSLVKQAISRLNSLHLPVLGVVANHVRETKYAVSSHYSPYYEQEHRLSPTTESNSKTSNRSVLAVMKEAEDDR